MNETTMNKTNWGDKMFVDFGGELYMNGDAMTFMTWLSIQERHCDEIAGDYGWEFDSPEGGQFYEIETVIAEFQMLYQHHKSEHDAAVEYRTIYELLEVILEQFKLGRFTVPKATGRRKTASIRQGNLS